MDFLVNGAGAQGILGLVLSHWQVRSGPGISGFKACGCWSWCQPTGEWGWVHGVLGLVPNHWWVNLVLELVLAHL